MPLGVQWNLVCAPKLVKEIPYFSRKPVQKLGLFENQFHRQKEIPLSTPDIILSNASVSAPLNPSSAN